MQLKDLKAGAVVSLQVAADPIKGVEIVGIGMVDVNELARQIFGIPHKP